MADPADMADAAVNDHLEGALHNARNRRSSVFHGFSPNRVCHWCRDPVSGDRLHCPPVENDCEAMHEKFIRFNRGR